MQKIIFLIFACLFFQINSVMPQEITYPLWQSGKVPNYQKTDEIEKRDTSETIHISLVQSPEITVYMPSKRNATGQAVIIEGM